MPDFTDIEKDQLSYLVKVMDGKGSEVGLKAEVSINTEFRREMKNEFKKLRGLFYGVVIVTVMSAAFNYWNVQFKQATAHAGEQVEQVEQVEARE